MPLSDYEHHNEEAQRIWWEEEGKHESEPREYDDQDADREIYDPCSDCVDKGHYLYVEFYIPDAENDDDATEKLRKELENQKYSWNLSAVDFEPGDEEIK